MKKFFVSAGVFAAVATVIFSLPPNGVAQEQPNSVKPSIQSKAGFSEYVVIRTNPSIFSETVNAKLKEGFLPQGGISVINNMGGESYAQAMVR